MEAKRWSVWERVTERTKGRAGWKGQRQAKYVLRPAKTQLRNQEIGNASEIEPDSIPPGLQPPTCQASVLGMRKIPCFWEGEKRAVTSGKSVPLSEPHVPNADKIQERPARRAGPGSGRGEARGEREAELGLGPGPV